MPVLVSMVLHVYHCIALADLEELRHKIGRIKGCTTQRSAVLPGQ
jgi:hypothetical protein